MKTDIKRTLARHRHILFAYIYGSSLLAERPNDIDVAVFLDPRTYREMLKNGELTLEFCIPLELELERAVHKRIDLGILNRASLGFRFRVVNSGELIIDHATALRCDFEYLTRVEYFDFRPKHEEYLREILQ